MASSAVSINHARQLIADRIIAERNKARSEERTAVSREMASLRKTNRALKIALYVQSSISAVLLALLVITGFRGL